MVHPLDHNDAIVGANEYDVNILPLCIPSGVLV
jgi:hypothetical protein